MRALSAGLAFLLCGSVAAPVHSQSASEPVVKRPDQMEWKAAPFSPYLATAILFGDPAKPGLYVIRVKAPAGSKIMPHFHPDGWRTAAVLSGTAYFGFGEKWDETKLKAYPPGTFFTEPKNTPHFAWAKDGEVIFQFTGMGPTGTKMIPQN